MRVLGLVVVMLLAMGVEASARCWFPRFHLMADQTVDVSMRADSGKPCTIVMYSPLGPMTGASIPQHPAHGTVEIRAITRITYRSRAGFVGEDSFTYTNSWRTRYGTPTVSTLKIAVTVSP